MKFPHPIVLIGSLIRSNIICTCPSFPFCTSSSTYLIILVSLVLFVFLILNFCIGNEKVITSNIIYLLYFLVRVVSRINTTKNSIICTSPSYLFCPWSSTYAIVFLSLVRFVLLGSSTIFFSATTGLACFAYLLIGGYGLALLGGYGSFRC